VDKIALIGLEFFGRHGVRTEEGNLGARFVVDLELSLDLTDVPDRLDETVNYGDVYETVKHEVTVSRFYLIEALANRIAERLLENHPRLDVVTVRVHKPHAPIQGVFRDVYTEVVRRRAAPV
jgi:dihydroneopterin aldolase